MVSSYQIGEEQEEANSPASPSIATDSIGTVRTTFAENGDKTETLLPIRASSSDGPSADPKLSRGILKTAKNYLGQPVLSHEIADDTRVTLAGGMEMTVRSAAQMGLLVKNAAGQWTEAAAPGVTGSERPKGEEPKEDGEDDDGEDGPPPRQDEETEAIMADAYTRAPQESISAAQAYVQAGGEMPQAATEALAARLGIEPAEAAAKVEQVTAGYTKEAHVSLSKTFGDDLSAEVFEWAKENARTKLNEAAMRHFNTGRPDYDAIARDYLVHLAKSDPQRIAGATFPGGATTRIAPDGTVVLRERNGVERSFVAAVRSGHAFPRKRR